MALSLSYTGLGDIIPRKPDTEETHSGRAGNPQDDIESHFPNWQCHHKPSGTNKTFKNTDITDKDRIDQTEKPSCDGCFPGGFKYLHQPIGICDVIAGQKMDDLVVVVLILSAPKDFIGREQIRHSWAGATHANTAPNVRYLFLLGSANSSQEQSRIDSEQAAHNDILQKDIPEGFLLMAVKTVMGLEWTATMCSRTRYILKTDIDSFVDVAALMSAIASVGPEVGLFGYCVYDGIPIRDPQHKHHMSWENNPAEYNPPYCFGAGYMLSMAAAVEVVRVAPDMKPVRMEDVYIGLCLREVRYRGNFKHRIHNMPGFLNMMTVKRTFNACEELHRKVVWHVASPAFFKNAWNTCYKHECYLA